MTAPNHACAHELLKTRVNALLRENTEIESTVVALNEALVDAYQQLKDSGFEPHDAELALVFTTREMLEMLWYGDRS